MLGGVSYLKCHTVVLGKASAQKFGIGRAKVLLVVEKRSCYWRLRHDLEARWATPGAVALQAVICCTQGIPTVACRLLVARVAHEHRLPVLALCDCGAGGLKIVLSFLSQPSISSWVPPNHANHLPCIYWIGLRASHVACEMRHRQSRGCDEAGLRRAFPGLTPHNRSYLEGIIMNNPSIRDSFEVRRSVTQLLKADATMELDQVQYFSCLLDFVVTAINDGDYVRICSQETRGY